jgi:hypothetical protein
VGATPSRYLRRPSLRRFAASSISLTTKERNNFESSTKDSKELELGVHGRSFIYIYQKGLDQE